MDEHAEAPDAVVIERIIDAPIERVWQLWTDPVHFVGWYGPDGASISVGDMDVRVGGRRFVGMEISTPSGPRHMWFVGEHREVVAGKRLVYTESIADEQGTMLSPEQMGMPEDHPVTTEVIVELEDLGDRTRLLLTHLGVPSGSPGAAGWTMAFDKLTTIASTR